MGAKQSQEASTVSQLPAPVMSTITEDDEDEAVLVPSFFPFHTSSTTPATSTSTPPSRENGHRSITQDEPEPPPLPVRPFFPNTAVLADDEDLTLGSHRHRSSSAHQLDRPHRHRSHDTGSSSHNGERQHRRHHHHHQRGERGERRSHHHHDRRARRYVYGEGDSSAGPLELDFSLMTLNQRLRDLQLRRESEENGNGIESGSPSSSSTRRHGSGSRSASHSHSHSHSRNHISSSMPVGSLFFMRSSSSGRSTCPCCRKEFPSSELETHLVMCVTKPRMDYNEDRLIQDAGECSICLEDMFKGDAIARLPCLCVYHIKCLKLWYEKNQTCPEHPEFIVS